MKILPKFQLIALCFFSFLFSANAQIFTKKIAAQILNAEATVEGCNQINSENLEFSPAFYENGLVFVSSRHDYGKEDDNIEESFFELFYADLNKKGIPTRPQPFSARLNSQLHEGPVAFSNDFQKIYFTRNNIKNGETESDEEGKIRLQIFEAEKSPSDWTNLKRLPFNSDEYSCAHPTLSADGNKLFFTSNMPGGQGEMDLYYVNRIGNSWGAPINLGPKINTPENETFPYIHKSGMLFFASNGHGGAGGLDIFMININKPETSVLTNLGAPFNSAWDDLGITVNPDGTGGFFTSARDGGKGKDDLYAFEIPQGLWIKDILPIQFTVADANTNLPLSAAAIRIFKSQQNGQITNSELYDIEITPNPNNDNEFSLQMIRKPNAELGAPDLLTNTSGNANTQLPKDENFVIVFSKENYETMEMTYSTAEKEGEQELKIFLTPNDCIMLNGEVLAEVYGTPIPGTIIHLENNCSQNPLYLVTNIDGKFNICLPPNCQFELTAQRTGFLPRTVQISTVGIVEDIQTTILLKAKEETAVREPIRKGSILIFDKIYYDFDKSNIRRGAAQDLDALAAIMLRYPSMKIEMTAHTDSRGDNAYNLELSLKRAESARDYLTDYGISADRITAFGFGENKLRNQCVDGIDCSEKEHQYNRRTEIKVIDIDEPAKISYSNEKPNVIDKKED